MPKIKVTAVFEWNVPSIEEYAATTDHGREVVSFEDVLALEKKAYDNSEFELEYNYDLVDTKWELIQ